MIYIDNLPISKFVRTITAMLRMQSTRVWVIIFWFALLQTLSPLMHAHIESDNDQQPHGIHMHNIADVPAEQSQLPHISDTDSESHIITVDKGALKEDFKFAPPLFALIIALLFIPQLVAKYHFGYLATPTPPLFYTHNASPRAPPLT